MNVLSSSSNCTTDGKNATVRSMMGLQLKIPARDSLKGRIAVLDHV